MGSRGGLLCSCRFRGSHVGSPGQKRDANGPQEVPSSSSSSDPPVHLAISDGVGGWSDIVDPSFFSQALMYHYAKSSSSLGKSQMAHAQIHATGKLVLKLIWVVDPDAHPRALLKKAYEGVLKEGSVVAGSATACGISVDSKGRLRGVKSVPTGLGLYR